MGRPRRRSPTIRGAKESESRSAALLSWGWGTNAPVTWTTCLKTSRHGATDDSIWLCFCCVVSGALLAWHWQRDGYPWAGFDPEADGNSQSAPRESPGSGSGFGRGRGSGRARRADSESGAARGATCGQSKRLELLLRSLPGSTSAAAAAAAKPADQSSHHRQRRPSPIPRAQANGGSAAQRLRRLSDPRGHGTDSELRRQARRRKRRLRPSMPSPKSVSPKPSPAAPAATFEDRLVADGEKYLYGRGVPEDCERAQRNLQIARATIECQGADLAGRHVRDRALCEPRSSHGLSLVRQGAARGPEQFAGAARSGSALETDDAGRATAGDEEPVGLR